MPLPPFRVGAHVSVANGLVAAAQKSIDMGANCLQVFSASPRVWQRKSLDSFDFSAYKAFAEKHDVQPLIVHGMYLLNLATNNPDNLQKSKEVIMHDLHFVSRAGGLGVVIHPGSHQGRGFEESKAQVVQTLVEILEKTPSDSVILLENAAQKAKIGSDLRELKMYISEVSAAGFAERIGWCYDTCHGFCAGYELTDVVRSLNELELWESLRVVHLNDAKDSFASGRDRHANLGEGQLTITRLQALLHHSQLAMRPWILEVPGFDGEGPDAKNIAIAKKLRSEE